MGCRFCASTIAGFVRCLTPYEILAQLYAAERDTGERVSSVVLMGIGEPLDNYDNVMRFLQMLSDSEGHNLSLRHLSLSTCGLVDGIDRLAKEGLQPVSYTHLDVYKRQVQEMNREVNTIGSKAQDLAVTNLVVEMKGTLEKIREQIQNVE